MEIETIPAEKNGLTLYLITWFSVTKNKKIFASLRETIFGCGYAALESSSPSCPSW